MKSHQQSRCGVPSYSALRRLPGGAAAVAQAAEARRLPGRGGVLLALPAPQPQKRPPLLPQLLTSLAIDIEPDYSSVSAVYVL